MVRSRIVAVLLVVILHGQKINSRPTDVEPAGARWRLARGAQPVPGSPSFQPVEPGRLGKPGVPGRPGQVGKPGQPGSPGRPGALPGTFTPHTQPGNFGRPGNFGAPGSFTPPKLPFTVTVQIPNPPNPGNPGNPGNPAGPGR